MRPRAGLEVSGESCLPGGRSASSQPLTFPRPNSDRRRRGLGFVMRQRAIH